MILRRHWIPLAFAFACFVGMGWTCSGQGQLENEWVKLEPGQSQKLGPFSLEEKARYVLELKMQGKPRHGFLADVELAVQREGDEEPLFELEDGYWAESGTWREGGESGTWYEKNGETKLYFAAPVAGKYSFTMTQNNNSNGAALNVRFSLSKKPYSAGAFLFGFFVFLVISLIVFLSRGRLFKKLLGQMGKGTVLKWDNKLWEVQDVLFFGDAGRDRPYANTPGAYSISYHLKSNDEEERYLSIETFDYEYEDSEGDDYDATFDAILISEPLTEAEQEKLSSVGKSTVNLRGKQFREDRDYSGVSDVFTEKEGMIFKSRVVEKVFMNSSRPENWGGKGNARHTAGIPDDDGDLVLSLTKYDDNDTEWELNRAINWQNLKVKRMVARKEIDFSAGNAA